MSQETIEIGMRANAAFNCRDLDVALQFFSPDAELRDLANAPDQASTVKGIGAIREAWTLWAAAFDEFHTDIEEWTDVGDAVIGAAHWRGRGRGCSVQRDRGPRRPLIASHAQRYAGCVAVASPSCCK